MPITENTPETELPSDQELDSLMNGTQGEGREIPMNDEEARAMQGQPPAQETPPPAAAQTPREYELEIRGQKIKATEDKILRWATQGYEAPNKIGELNQKLAGYQQKYESIKQFEKYGSVDEYAAKNPEWWNHVMESYKNRQAQASNPNDPISHELSSVKNELNSVKQFIDQAKADKEQAMAKETALKVESEDKALDSEIKSIQELYPNFDWNRPDPSGKSLELKVLEYAAQNDIKSFKTAFRDFYHDQLQKVAEERGKESVNKDIQKKTKLGFLGQTSTPKKGISPATNVKNQSYEQLLGEALDEAGIA